MHHILMNPAEIPCRAQQRTKRKPHPTFQAARLERKRRKQCREFLQSRRGRKFYRVLTAKPFNDRLKSLFGLKHRVWHRRLDCNRIQLLEKIFAYQILLRYNHRCGNEHGQSQWIINTL